MTIPLGGSRSQEGQGPTMGDRKKPVGEVSAEDLHAAISTFTKNAAVFTDASASDEAVKQAGVAIRDAMPTLRAAGMLRVFRVKNAKLRQYLTPKKKGAGKGAKKAAAGADAG
jgi:hypothetical protein